MNWTLFDYLVAGGLIGALIFGLFVISRLGRSRGMKIALSLVLVGLIALVWADGAVGVF